MLTCCWFSYIECPICNYHTDPRSEYNRQKSKLVSINGAGGVWGLSETPAGPLRKFLGFKEHLNWLKIDLNAGEIITIHD